MILLLVIVLTVSVMAQEPIDPVVEGSGANARFVSGTGRVSWSRTTSANPPAEGAPETGGSAAQPSQAQRVYVLKAWQMDDDPKTYLWSIEDQLQSDSPGTLYKSLASSSLRARVGAFPAGTKISFRFRGGGDWATVNAVMGDDFRDFAEFCKSKKINFNFMIDTD